MSRTGFSAIALTGVWLALTLAPSADADPTFPSAGDESASATVKDLRSQGYSVIVNNLEGTPNVPMSECQVLSIDDPSPPTAAPSTVTLTVNVSCPNAK